MKTHFSDADGSRCEDLTDWKALGAESVVLKLKEFCFSQENAGLLTPGFLFERRAAAAFTATKKRWLPPGFTAYPLKNPPAGYSRRFVRQKDFSATLI